MWKTRLILVLLIPVLWWLAGEAARAAEYDPLAVTNADAVRTVDLTVKDDARDREIPLRVHLPASRTAEALASSVIGSEQHGSGNNWDPDGCCQV